MKNVRFLTLAKCCSDVTALVKLNCVCSVDNMKPDKLRRHRELTDDFTKLHLQLEREGFFKELNK